MPFFKVRCEGFTQRLICLLNTQVYAAEVICRLQNIIHIDRFGFHADGVGLVDVPGLIVGQAAALDVVGVVGELDLHLVVDTALDSARFLRTEKFQQILWLILLLIESCRTDCILLNVPGLTGNESPLNAPFSGVVAHRTLRYAPFLHHLGYRYILRKPPPIRLV